MEPFSVSLLFTTGSVALMHALVGPDHWLPFVMLSRARRWTLWRTLLVTLVCGLGHVLSSVGLGLLATALGWQATRLAGVEGARGLLAAWLLLAFGVAYAAWGVRRGARRRRGLELHAHDGSVHLHAQGERPHAHEGAPDDDDSQGVAFWTLFVVFVLGPCEPMIPLLVAPASRGQWSLTLWVAAVFSAMTIVAMLAIVAIVRLGLVHLRFARLARWSHALAGGAIALCGLAVILGA